jgi:hypothetical protein
MLGVVFGVVSIVDNMRKNILKWFGYLMKREKTKSVEYCKSGYENERWKEKRKRKIKKVMVEYDWEWYEGCWCVRRGCKKSKRVEV